MSLERPRVLFVLGAGHCGSTLLSLLMNGHPDFAAVSELSKLGESIANGDPVLSRPEWRDIAACYESRTGAAFSGLDLAHPSWRRFAGWGASEAAAWAQRRASLLACIRDVTGRSWIIDASKSWQQLYLMQRSELFDLRVVHLIRDGRGVVHSYARKYGNLRHGLAKWIKPSVAAVALAAHFQERWLRVRYEELAVDTVATLTGICNLVDLEYEPSMLEFRRHAWIGIGGNRMSHRTDQTIQLDERWRREMPWRHRLLVGIVGGALNRFYGY